MFPGTLLKAQMSVQVATFYRFVSLPQADELQPVIKDFCRQNDILGIILIANEGINATISGPQKSLEALFETFNHIPELANLEVKYSSAEKHPFSRIRVRRKPEIVTMRQPQVDPNQMVGEYVDAEDWNELIQNPNTVVIDVRNEYETMHGTFEGAIDPKTEFFHEFPEWALANLPDKNQQVAMFCTGGIRCEKATSFLKQQGYKNIYHLKGGILKYIEDIPAEESTWKGDCFVFDHRGCVNHDLAPSGPDHQLKKNQRDRRPQSSGSA